RGEDAVEITLEDGRHVEPPLREYEDQAVGGLEPINIGLDSGAVEIVGHVASAFRHGETRIEVLGIKIEEIDLVAARFQGFDDCVGGGGSETLAERVGEDDEELHDLAI